MAEEPPVKIICIRISGTDQAIRKFLSKHPQEPNSVKRDGDSVVLEVCAPEQFVEAMKDAGIQVEVLFDASARGRVRQNEVGQGNRFMTDQQIPKGLGIRTKEGGL